MLFRSKISGNNLLKLENLERQVFSVQYSCHQCGNELKEGLIDKSFFDVYRVDKSLDKVRLAKALYTHLEDKIYFVLRNKKEAFLFQGYLGALEDKYSFINESDIDIISENVFCTALKPEEFYNSDKNYWVCLTENEFDKQELTESGLIEAFQDRFNVRFRSC